VRGKRVDELSLCETASASVRKRGGKKVSAGFAKRVRRR
jgi:hypothetical protein